MRFMKVFFSILAISLCAIADDLVSVSVAPVSVNLVPNSNALNFEGSLQRIENTIYLITGQNRFQMVTTSQDATDTIGKLADGDQISGSGHMEQNQIVIDTINFVGLRHLIGVWQNATTRIIFRDFSSVEVIDIRTQAVNRYTYSLSPHLGQNDWKFFMSDSQRVILNSLLESPGKITITVFDDSSGAIKNQVDFYHL